MSVRIGSRSINERTFSVELGNNEGSRDLKRNYETRVVIKPIELTQMDDDSDAGTMSDIDSIRSDLSNAALEVLDNSLFTKLDGISDLTTAGYQNDSFTFEKGVFNFWHDPGVIEIPVQCEVPGLWELTTRYG